MYAVKMDVMLSRFVIEFSFPRPKLKIKSINAAADKFKDPGPGGGDQKDLFAAFMILRWHFNCQEASRI
jgi:hypothetical protein